MPEYLAPGVYVEETSFRPKSIEGVSTSTAGFVGPTRYGPEEGEPPLLTSFADFERIYGGLEDIDFQAGGSGSAPEGRNYLAYGVRAFFEEGGQRCYVARVTGSNAAAASGSISGGSNGAQIDLNARFKGFLGEVRVAFDPVVSGDVCRADVVDGSVDVDLSGVSIGETVFVIPASGSSVSGPGFFDYVVSSGVEQLEAPDGGTVALSDLARDASDRDAVYRVRAEISYRQPERGPAGVGTVFGTPQTLGTFNLRPGADEAFTTYLAEDPPSDQVRYRTPFYVEIPTSSPEIGAAFAQVLFSASAGTADPSGELTADDVQRDGQNGTVTLSGGVDGQHPTASEYAGTDGSPGAKIQTGLGALQDIDEVSIVAAPGYTARGVNNAQAVQNELISHCERLQYRIAVLDTKPGEGVGSARDWRGQIDSSHAAIYYPWITIFDPVSRAEIDVPPSGFTAGIYARNDVEHGVQKAPANEVVRSAVGLETRINKAQQDVLNPDGINCYRFFEGRGYRLWGARTATSDPEFQYVNVRRYLAYLERSLDEGTQMFVFESNGPDLWRNVVRTVGSFLKNEWRSDRLLGTTAEQAYFVRCDRSTMTQNDLDNGRLICEVGVALLKPAEFVIFRVGQKLMESGG